MKEVENKTIELPVQDIRGITQGSTFLLEDSE